jgi:hypothetical protein
VSEQRRSNSCSCQRRELSGQWQVAVAALAACGRWQSLTHRQSNSACNGERKSSASATGTVPTALDLLVLRVCIAICMLCSVQSLNLFLAAVPKRRR